MTPGQLMRFTRESFSGDVRRNCSVVAALLKRWGPEETEVLLRGAQLLGWHDLVSLNAKEGIGRRWAHEAYWHHQQRTPVPLEALGVVLRSKGLVQ